MKNEKREEIFKALQGITYSEWTMLSMIITRSFEKKSSEQKDKLLIATPDELKDYRKFI